MERTAEKTERLNLLSGQILDSTINESTTWSDYQLWGEIHKKRVSQSCE